MFLQTSLFVRIDCPTLAIKPLSTQYLSRQDSFYRSLDCYNLILGLIMKNYINFVHFLTMLTKFLNYVREIMHYYRLAVAREFVRVILKKIGDVTHRYI